LASILANNSVVSRGAVLRLIYGMRDTDLLSLVKNSFEIVTPVISGP